VTAVSGRAGAICSEFFVGFGDGRDVALIDAVAVVSTRSASLS
jgi:hypothetical protein